MSQSDGELAWHGKTYNALKDKKHLTGINKEVILGMTPSDGRQKDGFPVEKLTGCVIWIEEFKR